MSRRPVRIRIPVGVAHAVDREFRVLQALWEQGFPVPEPLVLCADKSVIGTMFYVMRHVTGRIFWDCTMPDLAPAERAAIFDSANATLAGLHRLDPARLGLQDFGRPGNYFARQIARWSQQYEAARSDDIAEMDQLMAWLPGAVPAAAGSALSATSAPGTGTQIRVYYLTSDSHVHELSFNSGWHINDLNQ